MEAILYTFFFAGHLRKRPEGRRDTPEDGLSGDPRARWLLLAANRLDVGNIQTGHAFRIFRGTYRLASFSRVGHFDRNGWAISIGISGPLPSESAADA
jgi:hypothetical protein